MILLPSLLIPLFSLPADMVFSIIPFEKTAIQSLFRLFSNAQCIDSLKAITKYFFVSVDDLLSSDTVLAIAEEDRKQSEKHSRTLVFGLLGLQRSAAALSSLRIRSNKTAQAVSLLSLAPVAPYAKPLFLVAVISLTLCGIAAPALQNAELPVWQRSKKKASLFLSIVGVFLFVVGLQLYAAVFAFVLLVNKALLYIK